jgi:outer membrane protein TolC
MFCTVLLVLAGATFANTYTLEMLLQAGFTNDHRLKLIEEEMRKADQKIDETRSGAMPVVDFTANVSHAFNQYNMFRDKLSSLSSSTAGDNGYPSLVSQLGPAATFPDSVLAYNIMYLAAAAGEQLQSLDLTAYPNAASFSLSVNQPLYAQGTVSLGLRIARLSQRSLVCKYQAAQDSVGAAIFKLFYASLLAQNTVTIKENAVTLARETHRIAVVNFSLGTGIELDTLTSRLNLENAQIEHQEALAQQKLSLEALIMHAGIVEQAGNMALQGDFPSGDFSISREEALERMQANNRQLSQLKTGEEVQAELVKLARADYMPTVFCGGSFSQIGAFESAAEVKREIFQSDYKVYLGVNMRLFDGLQRSSKVQQAFSDLRAFHQTRKIALDGLQLATKKAWEDMETARQKLIRSQSVLTLAEKSYAIAKTTFELGSMTMQDFRLREQDLNAARLAQTAARFAFHSAVVDLQVLMGELPVQEYVKTGAVAE